MNRSLVAALISNPEGGLQGKHIAQFTSKSVSRFVTMQVTHSFEFALQGISTADELVGDASLTQTKDTLPII